MIDNLIRRFHGVHRGTIVSILVVGYLFGAGVTWAAITPLGGVPDEPGHIAYAAAVVRGDLGTPGRVSNPNFSHLAIVTVPEWIASINTCYAFQPDVTADCAPPIGTSEMLIALPTGATRYPPLYYWIVGLPTFIIPGAPAVYTMRAISAVLAAGLVGIGLVVASPSRRAWLALAALIAFTPMVGHIAGSVNPSGMEISAALGLAIALVGKVCAERRVRSTVLTSGLVVVLAWARPISVMTLAAVVLVGILANGANLRRWVRDRAVRNAMMVVTSVTVLSALAYEVLVRDPVERIITVGAAGGPANQAVGLIENLRSVERLFVSWGFDLVGRFGWLDHNPPSVVQLGWLVLAATLLVFALAIGTRKGRLAVGVTTVGALVVAPLFVLEFVAGSAKGYQARYHLPVVMLLTIVAASVIAESRSDDNRRSGWSILRWGSLLTATGMLISIAGSMHRYAVGGVAGVADLLTFRFLSDAIWLPGEAVAVLAVGTAVLVTSAVLVFVATRVEIGESRPNETESGSD